MRLLKTSGIILLVAGLLNALVPGADAQTANIANYVVISEIHIDGSDDWIELYNPTNQPIDLKAGNYRIERAASSGSNPGKFIDFADDVTADAIIPAHGYYLIVDIGASAELL